jgi:hypothetical protein
MRPIKRLILHIGLPKTGSSLIQRSLRSIRRPMRRRGVAYISRGRIRDLANYPRGAGGKRPVSPEFVAELRAAVEEEAAKELRRIDTVLISNEAAAGWPRGDEPFWPHAAIRIEALIESIKPASTEIVAYVRRQDRFLESLYMQRIHGGDSISWEQFRDKTCGDDRVRYAELLDSLVALPTVERMRIRPFEIIAAGAAAFVADFLDGIGVGELVLELEPKTMASANPSYTVPAWQAAMAINRFVDTEEKREEVRRFLREMFPLGEYPKPELLTETQRMRLIERYSPHNERLFAKYLPEFPVDAYSTLEGVSKLEGFLSPIGLLEPPHPEKRRLADRMRAAAAAARREWRDR